MNRVTLQVFVTLAFAASCCSTSKDGAQVPGTASNESDCTHGARVTCDPRIQHDCYGCNPLDQRLIDRMALSCLPQYVRRDVSHCANAALDIAVKDKSFAKANVDGCIKSVQKLDPELKAELVKLVDTVLTADKQYESWLACYDCHLKGTCKPKIAILDEHDPTDNGNVYCEETRRLRGSNADDIMPILSDLGVEFDTFATYLGWHDDQRVVDTHPVLVIIHASAFYENSVELQSDARLIEFLKYLGGSNTKVLVYSRGVDGDTPETIQSRWRDLKRRINFLRLQGRVDLFEMPMHRKDCFRHPDTARAFKLKVKEMLAME